MLCCLKCRNQRHCKRALDANHGVSLSEACVFSAQLVLLLFAHAFHGERKAG